MTLHWVARIALILYALYAISYISERARLDGSAALKTLGAATEGAILTVLVWAGWYA